MSDQPETGPCTVYYLSADKEFVIATTWQPGTVAAFRQQGAAEWWAYRLNAAYAAGLARGVSLAAGHCCDCESTNGFCFAHDPKAVEP